MIGAIGSGTKTLVAVIRKALGEAVSAGNRTISESQLEQYARVTIWGDGDNQIRVGSDGPGGPRPIGSDAVIAELVSQVFLLVTSQPGLKVTLSMSANERSIRIENPSNFVMPTEADLESAARSLVVIDALPKPSPGGPPLSGPQVDAHESPSGETLQANLNRTPLSAAEYAARARSNMSRPDGDD